MCDIRLFGVRQFIDRFSSPRSGFSILAVQGAVARAALQNTLFTAEFNRGIVQDERQAVQSAVDALCLIAPEKPSISERPFTMEDFVTVATYLSLAEAEPHRLALEAAGIPTLATDESMGDMLGSNMVGGIKLQVAAKDADRAKEVLADVRPSPSRKRPMRTDADDDVSPDLSGSAGPRSGSRPNAGDKWKTVPSAGPMWTCRSNSLFRADLPDGARSLVLPYALCLLVRREKLAIRSC